MGGRREEVGPRNEGESLRVYLLRIMGGEEELQKSAERGEEFVRLQISSSAERIKEIIRKGKDAMDVEELRKEIETYRVYRFSLRGIINIQGYDNYVAEATSSLESVPIDPSDYSSMTGD